MAAADVPAIIIVGRRDALFPENALIFQHLGSPEKTLISFLGLDHGMMVSDSKVWVRRSAHFAAAFFGHQLQDREDMRYYDSEE